MSKLIVQKHLLCAITTMILLNYMYNIYNKVQNNESKLQVEKPSHVHKWEGMCNDCANFMRIDNKKTNRMKTLLFYEILFIQIP